MHAHEADADADEGFETFHCLGGAENICTSHAARKLESRFCEAGLLAKAPPPIGCSANLCNDIAAFQQTCFRY